MQEVSCGALTAVLKAAKKQKVDPEVLTAGLDYDLGYLRNTKNRIEWEAFCRFLTNARAAWSLDQMSDLGGAFMRSPFWSYVGVFARLLFNARDLFDWICKRSVGGGAQLFSQCVRTHNFQYFLFRERLYDVRQRAIFDGFGHDNLLAYRAAHYYFGRRLNLTQAFEHIQTGIVGQNHVEGDEVGSS